jgi:dolichol-phosphate mannosyltransferase
VAERVRTDVDQFQRLPPSQRLPAGAVAFFRFAAVGGLGYVVNLVLFALLVRAGADALPAAVTSWTVAALHNYTLNRCWTFREARGPTARQGAQFLLVSLGGLAVNLLVLELLVVLGTPHLLAQALALAAALPVNFAGSRLWVFGPAAPEAAAPARVYAPGRKPDRVRAVVCIPTYNERRNLEPMLLALEEILGPDDVALVIDDGSPDGTGALADHLADRLGFVQVLHRPAKQGLGRAYREGFRHALGLGCAYAVELDCDFSHDPRDIPRLIAAARGSGLALGSRYVEGGSADGLRGLRRLLSRGGSLYSRLVLGVKTRDLTGGFKCYRRDVLEAIDPDTLSASGYAFQIEGTYRAARAGFPAAEVPIDFGDRKEGASKMSGAIAAEALWRVPWMRLSVVLAGERARAYATVLGWWLLSRVLVFTAVTIVQLVGWPRRSWYLGVGNHPFSLLNGWDGRWYRMVAEGGYLVLPHHQSDTAFFPLFPLLISLLGGIGMSPEAAGLLVANAGLVVALLALYELTRLWVDESTARRAAVYAAIFPVGYAFSMAYPESILVAAMALAGVLAARGRWRGAAACAAVGAIARPEAIFLVLPLGALAIRRWRTASSRERAHMLTAVGAAPAALGGLMLYHWRTFGDPIAFSTAQQAWGRRFSVDGVHRAIVELAHSPGTENVWLFRDAAFCVLYVLCLALAIRVGVPKSWTLAGALIVLLPVWSGSFTSDARFGMVALPVYSGLAALGRRAWLDRTLRVTSLALLTAAAATILLRWP